MQIEVLICDIGSGPSQPDDDQDDSLREATLGGKAERAR